MKKVVFLSAGIVALALQSCTAEQDDTQEELQNLVELQDTEVYAGAVSGLKINKAK